MADEPNLNGLAGSKFTSMGAGQTAQKYARDMLANYWKPAVQASKDIRSNMEAAARAMQAATGAAGKVNLSSFDVADGFTGSRVMGRPTFSTNSAGVTTPLSRSREVARFSGGGALVPRQQGLGLAGFSTPSASQQGFSRAAFGGAQRAIGSAGYYQSNVVPYSGGGAVMPYSGGGQIMPFGNQGGGGDGGGGLPLPRGGYNFGKVGMGLAGAAVALSLGGPTNQDTYTRDLLAQTLVQTGGSATSAKQFRTQYGNMSGSFSVSDMAGAYGGIANMGFGAGTKGFDYNTTLVSQLANQSGMGGAASQSIYANLMGGQTTNRMRAMLGISTMNQDGSVKNINSLAKQLMSKLGGGGLSLTDLNKALAPGRNMDFNLDQLGLDDNTKQQLIASMRAQAVGGAGLSSLNPGRATVAALANQNQKQTNDALTQDARSTAVTDFQNAVKDFHGAVQDLENWFPVLKTVIGDFQGVKQSIGNPGGGGGTGGHGGLGSLLGGVVATRVIMKAGGGLLRGGAQLAGSAVRGAGSAIKSMGKGVGGAADTMFGWFPDSVGGSNKWEHLNTGGGAAYSNTDGAGPSGGGGAGPSVSTGPNGSAAVAIARKYLGIPYKWGGNGPGGFDCSGLVKAVYAQLGVNLPRTAAEQARMGSPVGGLAAAVPGDLLFWGQPAHHVAIYIGNGMMIAAPHTGTNVQVQKVYGNPYVRRVLGANNTMSGKNSNTLVGGTAGGQPNNMIGGGSTSAGAFALGSSLTSSSTGVVGSGMSAGDLIAAALSGSPAMGVGGGGSTGMGSNGSVTGGGSTTNTGGGGSVPTNVSGNAALIRRMAKAYGWDKGTEWTDLYKVVNRESSFDNNNQNPKSTAYGLFQFLNQTWTDMGFKKTSDPTIQTEAGLKYIKSRYSDPIGAWRSEQQRGFYAQGAYEIAQDQDARVHAGEMVLTKDRADLVRAANRKGGGGGGNTIVNHWHVMQMTEAEINRVMARMQQQMGSDSIVNVLRNG